MDPILFNIQHFSIQDGPGIRTVLFFKGCPLRCAWCHNPEGLTPGPVLSFDPSRCTGCGACAAVCPQGAHLLAPGEHRFLRERCIACGVCGNRCPTGALELFGRRYALDEILEHISRDRAFYGKAGGVTLSGGEPFAQPEALAALLPRLKQEGFHVCVETSGYTEAEYLQAAARYTDLFLYDCKETSPQRHRAWTGVDNQRILQNLQVLDQAGAAVVLRCPIIPGINDTTEHMTQIAALANRHASVLSIELMPYHPLGIAKAAGVGRALSYTNPNFADKGAVEALAAVIAANTAKPVKVN